MRTQSRYSLAVVSAILSLAVARAEDTTATNRLADVTGSPVTNGYVFFNGTYIEPPYHVSSSNGAIFVNGLWGRPEGTWPPIDWSVAELPQVPSNITDQSTMDDLDVKDDRLNGYFPRLMRYYHMRYPESEAIQKVIEAHRALPFVVSVKPHPGDEDTITVTTTSGLSFSSRVGVRGDEYFFRSPPSKASVEVAVEKARHKYESFLKSGGALFLFDSEFTNKGRSKLSGRHLAEELPILLRICAADLSDDEKMSELQRLKILNMSDNPRWRSLVENLTVTPALAQRVTVYGDPASIQAEREAELKRQEDYIRRVTEEAQKRKETTGGQ